MNAEEDREQGFGDFDGAFFVGEECCAFDYFELGVGERADHLVGPLEWEEGVLVAPHEPDGHRDSTMHIGELMNAFDVEAVQHADGGVTAGRDRVDWLEEELVKFAFEQRTVGERVAEHKTVTTQAGLAEYPPESGRDAGHMAGQKKCFEAPRQSLRLLSVDQTHRP